MCKFDFDHDFAFLTIYPIRYNFILDGIFSALQENHFQKQCGVSKTDFSFRFCKIEHQNNLFTLGKKIVACLFVLQILQIVNYLKNIVAPGELRKMLSCNLIPRFEVKKVFYKMVFVSDFLDHIGRIYSPLNLSNMKIQKQTRCNSNSHHSGKTK